MPEGRHKTQYFEMFGNRAIYHDGWLARAVHRAHRGVTPPTKRCRNDPWELYNIEEDFSLSDNLASEMPEKLAEMKAIFEKEAIANHVYPAG